MNAVKMGWPPTNSSGLKSSLDWVVWSPNRYSDKGAAMLSVEAVVVSLAVGGEGIGYSSFI